MGSRIGPIPFGRWTVPMTSILVVDDERAVRDVVRLYLEQDGYDVSTASNGTDAVAAFESGKPDLVVLDLKDGTVLQQVDLGTEPAFQGLAIANHSLFVTTKNGIQKFASSSTASK